MEYEDLLLGKDDSGIATLTLNVPSNPASTVSK